MRRIWTRWLPWHPAGLERPGQKRNGQPGEAEDRIALQPSASVGAVPWRFSAPASLEDLERLLLDDNPMVLVAGGQSILPVLQAGKRGRAHLVDITKIDGLRRLEASNGRAWIGAAATLTDILESDVAVSHPVVAQALGYVGTRPIRNRATVGGSLAWADPRAELPLVLLALGGRIRTNRREIAAADFIRGPYQTALLTNELILGVELPARRGSLAFGEIMGRNSAGRAVVLAAVESDAAMIRITVGGLADRPVSSPWIEPAEGAAWLGSVTENHPALDDPFHTLSYRLAIARVLVERASGKYQ